MVRNFKKRTTRGEIPPEVILKAVRSIKIGHASIRQAANHFNINYRTLARYVKKIEEADANQLPLISVGYRKNRQVFSAEAEDVLARYLAHASNVCYGLSRKDLRKLAFQVGEANNLKMPQNWTRNRMAGADWLDLFIKRHPHLSIRTPEGGRLRKASGLDLQKLVTDPLAIQGGGVFSLNENVVPDAADFVPLVEKELLGSEVNGPAKETPSPRANHRKKTRKNYPRKITEILRDNPLGRRPEEESSAEET